MKNPHKAIAALVVAGAMAWPAGSAAIGASAPAPRHPSDAAVVTANAQVREEIDQLGAARPGGTMHKVSVGERLPDLLQDRRFLDNVHVLQSFLNNNDAGVLTGADVAITDLVAIDVQLGGDVIVFTR